MNIQKEKKCIDEYFKIQDLFYLFLKYFSFIVLIKLQIFRGACHTILVIQFLNFESIRYI